MERPDVEGPGQTGRIGRGDGQAIGEAAVKVALAGPLARRALGEGRGAETRRTDAGSGARWEDSTWSFLQGEPAGRAGRGWGQSGRDFPEEPGPDTRDFGGFTVTMATRSQVSL